MPGHKTGLFLLITAGILVFLAGSLTTRIAYWLADKAGLNPDSRLANILLAGVSSLISRLYRTIVFKLAGKGLRRLLAG